MTDSLYWLGYLAGALWIEPEKRRRRRMRHALLALERWHPEVAARLIQRIQACHKCGREPVSRLRGDVWRWRCICGARGRIGIEISALPELIEIERHGGNNGGNNVMIQKE